MVMLLVRFSALPMKPEAAAAGTEIEVVIMNEKRRGIVLGEPLYDPENSKPRVDA